MNSHDSHAKLTYAKGMHLGCVDSAEFEIGRECYRAEAYKDIHGNLSYAGYVRIGAYWRPCTCYEQPTFSPRIVDTYGLRLLARARLSSGELQL